MKIQRLTIILLMVCSVFSIKIQARSIPTVQRSKADSLAHRQVMMNGRVVTLSTLATKFLKTIYGKRSYHGLTPEQVLIGWGKNEPMIRIDDVDLREKLHINGQYATFTDLFDDTLGYRLNTLHKDLPEHLRQIALSSPNEQELDEKVGLIILLTRGELVQPRKETLSPLSSLYVKAEVLYNRLSGWSIFLVVAVVIAVIGLFCQHAVPCKTFHLTEALPRKGIPASEHLSQYD